MKALTVKQPWASLIAAGFKRIETRGWKTAYRGQLAIHAGLEVDLEYAVMVQAFLPVPFEQLPRGAIVCTVSLADVVPTERLISSAPAMELRLGDYRPGRWGWILEHVITVHPAYPCRGALGLWETDFQHDRVR